MHRVPASPIAPLVLPAGLAKAIVGKVFAVLSSGKALTGLPFGELVAYLAQMLMALPSVET